MIRADATSEFRSGWRLLLGSSAGAMCGVSALYFYTQGLFIKPIAAEFGWSRTALSLGGFITVGASAVLSPLCGAVIDRVGVRRFATLSMLGFALALWLLTRLSGSLPEYYGLMVVLALLSSGTTPLSFSRAVSERFVIARGTALGIVGAGIGVAATVAPGYFSAVLVRQGWQHGYATMALLVLAVAPIVWVLLRPGAAVSENMAPGPEALGPGAGFSGAEAMRMPRFWILGAMLLTASLGASALIVHFVPIMTDAGFSPASAAGYAGAIGVSVIGSRLSVGALLDRVSAPTVGATIFASAAAGALLLAFAGAHAAWVVAPLLGLALGAESDLVGYLIARYFGLRAYGFIYGTLYAAFLAGMATGPVLASVVYDRMHNYQLAVLGAAAAFLLASALSRCLGACRSPA